MKKPFHRPVFEQSNYTVFLNTVPFINGWIDLWVVRRVDGFFIYFQTSNSPGYEYAIEDLQPAFVDDLPKKRLNLLINYMRNWKITR